MKVRYFIRLDDACPKMNHDKWAKIIDILDSFNIKPMIGIIPANEDKDTMPNVENPDFWQMVDEWGSKGYAIALHGFNHCCLSKSAGVNPVHSRSEFAGLPLKLQCIKIAKGYEILRKHGAVPEFFFAPSHTFDKNTIKAIIRETPIRYISDTFALKPYHKYGMTFFPVQMGRFRNVTLPGYWTFCYHPNNMSDKTMEHFERFIAMNQSKFGDFKDLLGLKWGKRTLFDCIMQRSYIIMRKLLNK